MCLNPNNKDFKRYGGRGIKVCDRWLESFWNFVEDMGERPEGMTINRINNDGDYKPLNCEWATQKTQCNNRANSGVNKCKPLSNRQLAQQELDLLLLVTESR